MTGAPAAIASAGLAAVIGAGGGLGAALLARLQQGSYARVLGLGRHAELRIDYLDESSIAAASQAVAALCRQASLELRCWWWPPVFFMVSLASLNAAGLIWTRPT